MRKKSDNSLTIEEKERIRLLLNCTFKLWCDYRGQSRQPALWQNEGPVQERIGNLLDVIRPKSEAPEQWAPAKCAFEMVSKTSYDDDKEISIANLFGDISLFFMLATGIREDSQQKVLGKSDILQDLMNDLGKKPGMLEAALFLRSLSDAFSFNWILGTERECVKELRRRRYGNSGQKPAGGKSRLDAPAEGNPGEDMQLVGLALSGGGIRSATFNLGLLQALAELKLLPHVDYLSTVSGGGYIGSWLQSWIRREKRFEEVRKRLSPKDSPDPESAGTRPIKWLRQFSNYLSPRLGMFSLDTWTIAAVWARNMLLNLMVLIPFFCGLLLVPRWLGGMLSRPNSGVIGCITAALMLVVAAYFIRANLGFGAPPDEGIQSDVGIRAGVSLCVIVSAFGVVQWLGNGVNGSGVKPVADRLTRMLASGSNRDFSEWVIGIAIFIVLAVLLFVLSRKYELSGVPSPEKPGDRIFRLTTRPFGIFLPSALGAWLLVFIAGKIKGPDPITQPWHLAAIGVPVVILIYSSVIMLHLGLLGRALNDQYREWWSRLSALLTTYILIWFALSGATIYGPWLLAWLTNTAYGWYANSGLGLVWLVTTRLTLGHLQATLGIASLETD